MSDIKAAAGRVTPHLFQVTMGVQMVRLNFYTGKGRMNWHKDDYNFAVNPSGEGGQVFDPPCFEFDSGGLSLWRQYVKEYCLIQSHRQPLNLKSQKQLPSVAFGHVDMQVGPIWADIRICTT